MNFRIVKEKGTRTVIDKNGSVSRIVPYIRIIARDSANGEEIGDLVERYGTNFRELYGFIVKYIAYVPDPKEEQMIRTAARTLYERKGNCVDYAILLSSYLQRLNVEHYFKLVRYKRMGDFEHIYIVLKNGLILDPVVKRFNYEARYNKSKLVNP